MDLEVTNLTKSFGPQKAVDNISFKVQTGEVLGFLGPNGAGKTTTMKILTSYMAPAAGDVWVNGYNIREDAEELKKHIGYLPENNPLYHDLPVIDHLRFVAALQGLEGRKIEQQVREMIRVTGLNPEKHKRVGELSKGYQQRMGLAQSMIHDPEVLILDEPTTGLDPNQIVEIRELIKELGREKTVILSTHILPEVEATCGRILIINDGQIVADGDAASLREQSAGLDEVQITVESASPDQVKTTMEALDNVEQVVLSENGSDSIRVQTRDEAATRRNIFNQCKENGWVLTEMTPYRSSLEDVFRRLTREQR